MFYKEALKKAGEIFKNNKDNNINGKDRLEQA
jgi:hypothetical protein